MQRLMLDLRDNPGRSARSGDRRVEPVPQARPDGRLHARPGPAASDEDYRAVGAGRLQDVPLIVMINRNSASASEIVSGAMQDHDRGAPRRRNDVRQGAGAGRLSASATARGLALTTGRYYTPSGRMIQRPWDGAFDEYLTYSYRDQTAAREHAAGRPEVHRRRPQGLQRRRHRAGSLRRRAGRGIQPVAVLAHAARARRVRRLRRTLHQGRRQPPGRASRRRVHKVAPGWQVTDAMVAEFQRVPRRRSACGSTKRPSRATSPSSRR